MNAHFIRTIWCSLPFYLVWERSSHTSFFSTTPLTTKHIKYKPFANGLVTTDKSGLVVAYGNFVIVV